MPVVETLAAVIGIIAGFATCAKFVKKVSENIKHKRAPFAALGQAEKLDRFLRSGGSAVERELLKLRGLNSYNSLQDGMRHLVLLRLY
jgi:hypothetical protein